MKSILLGIISNDTIKEDKYIIDVINYILYKGVTSASFSKFIVHRHIYEDLLKNRIIKSGKNCLDSFNKTFGLKVKEDELNYKYFYCIDSGKVTNIKLNHEETEKMDNGLIAYTINNIKYINLYDLYRYYCNMMEDAFEWFNWDIKDIQTATSIALLHNAAMITNIKYEQSKLIKSNDSLYGGVIIIKHKEDFEKIADANTFYINRDDNKTVIFYKIIDIVTKINKQLN